MSLDSRLRLNLGLAATLLALGGLVAYLTLHGEGEKPATLTPLKASEVTHIVIDRDDRPSVELSKENGEWWLVQPFRIAASRYRAEALAALAQEPTGARYAVEGLDLARYGLDPGVAELHLNDTAIVFGNANPVNNKRYVRVGDAVYLISDNSFGVLTAEVASFVGPRLLPEGATVEALHMPGVGLERADEGWRLDPERPEIGADDIQRLLKAWEDAEALWAKPYSGRPATGAVELRLSGSQTLHFDILETDPDLVLARPDLELEYTLPSEQIHGLLELTPAPEESAPKPAAD